MKNVGLIFPHQLMEDTTVFAACDEVYLVEEYLFFRQFSFHKRKLAYHRATMKQYESFLQEKGFSVRYIDTSDERSDIRTLIQGFSTEGISVVHYIDPTDNWLEKRLKCSAKAFHISLEKHPSPLFLNEIDDFAKGIEWCLKNISESRMVENRNDMINKFSLEKIGKKYNHMHMKNKLLILII